MYEAPPSPPSSPRQQSPIRTFLKTNKSTNKTNDTNQKSIKPKKEVSKTKMGTGNLFIYLLFLLLIKFIIITLIYI